MTTNKTREHQRQKPYRAFLTYFYTYSSESPEFADPLDVNILSFQRPDSNENFLKSPKTGTMKSTINAKQKLTPRFTPCSTFTETGI